MIRLALELTGLVLLALFAWNAWRRPVDVTAEDVADWQENNAEPLDTCDRIPCDDEHREPLAVCDFDPDSVLQI